MQENVDMITNIATDDIPDNTDEECIPGAKYLTSSSNSTWTGMKKRFNVSICVDEVKYLEERSWTP